MNPRNDSPYGSRPSFVPERPTMQPRRVLQPVTLFSTDDLPPDPRTTAVPTSRPSQPQQQAPQAVSPSVPPPSELTTEPLPSTSTPTSAPVQPSSSTFDFDSDQTQTSATTSAEQSAALAQTTAFGSGLAQSVAPKSAGSGRKKLAIAGGLVLGCLLLTGGVVFGYYLPNTPENVYKTGMERTSTAVNVVVAKAVSPAQQAKFEQSAVTGELTVKNNQEQTSGSIKLDYDDKASDTDASLTLPGKQPVNLKVLTLSNGSTPYPDVFFRLSNSKQLGLDEYLGGASSFDGKWISLTADDVLAVTGSEPTVQKGKRPTSGDVSEVAKAVTSVTTDYLFTADPTKAVFTKPVFETQEKSDGKTYNRYKVTFDTAHAATYCNAMIEQIFATKAYRNVTGYSESEIAEQRRSEKDSCDKEQFSDTAKDSYQLWVDTSTKLIYKIRITDHTEKTQYFEFGQTSKDDSEVSLFAHSAGSGESKYDLTVQMTSNFDSAATDLKLSGSFTFGDTETSVDGNMTIKPRDEPMKVERPAGAIPFMTMYEQLMNSAQSESERQAAEDYKQDQINLYS